MPRSHRAVEDSVTEDQKYPAIMSQVLGSGTSSKSDQGTSPVQRHFDFRLTRENGTKSHSLSPQHLLSGRHLLASSRPKYQDSSVTNTSGTNFHFRRSVISTVGSAAPVHTTMLTSKSNDIPVGHWYGVRRYLRNIHITLIVRPLPSRDI